MNENVYGIHAPDLGDKILFDTDTRGGLQARLRMHLAQLELRRKVYHAAEGPM